MTRGEDEIKLYEKLLFLFLFSFSIGFSIASLFVINENKTHERMLVEEFLYFYKANKEMFGEKKKMCQRIVREHNE